MTTDTPSGPVPTDGDEADDLPEQMRVRRAKLVSLRHRGVEPYPVTFPRTTTLAALRQRVGELPPDTATGERVGVTGRVVLKRDGGKLCFATLRDGTGDLQVMLSLDRVGAEALELWKADVDLADHVGVEGEVVTSRRGELSVLAERFTITAKALRPLPDKHKGLTDPEARVRMRYVDLIVRPEARDMVYLRAGVVRAVRDVLHERGFTEVETPILQVLHGGANARPFVTHINAYDMPLYLRIAPELYLKRLLVGGIEKVFEINRNFRNEGADSTHNPEFTMLEAYEADGVVREYDLSGDFPVATMAGALSEALGEPVDLDTDVEVLRRHAVRVGLDEPPQASASMLLEELYVHLVEKPTTTPVFYQDFPKDNAPLTRAHRDDPRLTEKWDLVCWGAEQGTGYSELTDPLDQAERFAAQARRAAGGDEEAMRLDEDFLRALEYGMPPAGGIGVGIDRLVMTLTGLGIRDTILFPLVKPR
jgi:lysyl-tRNA synthetase class 2